MHASVPAELIRHASRRENLPRRGWPPVPTLLLGALIAAAVCAVAARAQQAPAGEPLTVERIYGHPSLSGSQTTGIEWSPDGKLVSFFLRSGEGAGARTDIWAMDAETGQRRLLVDADTLTEMIPLASAAQNQKTGMGRVAPQRYLWSPKGDALLFVSQGHLYWFDLKTKKSKPLAAAGAPEKDGGKAAIGDPKISPDGRWVSFVRNYDLWLVSVATGQERQLTHGGREELMNGQLDWVYPEELGIRTAYWWSPDSTQIALLQMDERPVTQYPLVDYLSYTGKTEKMRYPKAGDLNPIVRVGVVPVSAGEKAAGPRWMDLGHETDIYLARVDWLRDSKRLALQRLNRVQTKLELLLVDTGSGQSHVILTEKDKFWVNVHDDLYFFADGERFLWSSEGDGFRHLYLYDLSGKQLKQLTRGNWEVTSLAGVDEKHRQVYFSATEKSPLERHLYRVSLEDGALGRITRQDGTHTIHLAPDAAHFVDTFSNTMTPPRQDLLRADGVSVAAINENKVPELARYALVRPEFFTVPGADGTPLHAMLIKPANFDPAHKHPVIVHLYGGPHAQVVRDAWGGANFLWHQMLAQKGFLIFSVDNRGMAGRGHDFETPIYHRMAQTELADQLAGVNYLKSLPYVDGSRLGIWGWSYGGYMTCYAMLNAADVFKAGFAGAPVTDWRQYDTIYTERYMGLPKENEEGYKQSSPVTHAAKLKGKLLIAAGTGDDNVHFANTAQLAEEFIKAGRYAEIQIYPGRGHGISDPTARVHIFRRVARFFSDNL